MPSEGKTPGIASIADIFIERLLNRTGRILPGWNSSVPVKIYRAGFTVFSGFTAIGAEIGLAGIASIKGIATATNAPMTIKAALKPKFRVLMH